MRAWLGLLLCASNLFGQQQSHFSPPDEFAGLDSIVQTLVSAFDHVDIVALGEDHGRKVDSDLRLALVRNPEFPKKVHAIVVEFGTTAQQATLDRYIRGDDVPLAELRAVWDATSQGAGAWDSPVYAEFYAAVRDVNRTLPADAQIRVLAGDPPAGSGLGRDLTAFAVLQKQVLGAHGKALVIYGAGHLLRVSPGDPVTRLMQMLQTGYPGQTFVVTTAGGPHPGNQAFEQALKTSARPVLISLQTPPFRDLPVLAFPGFRITSGQIADACVYYGMSPDFDVWVTPPR